MGEQISSQHSLSGIEPDEMSPFYEKRLAKFPADPETDVVAENCASRGRSDDPAIVQRLVPAYTAAGTRMVSPGIGMPPLSSITITKIAP
jgi:hypothetical protein